MSEYHVPVLLKESVDGLDIRQGGVYPDLSIKEIADQLNFPTQSFFGKYFKQYVGISTKEYRKGRLRIKDGI